MCQWLAFFDSAKLQFVGDIDNFILKERKEFETKIAREEIPLL